MVRKCKSFHLFGGVWWLNASRASTITSLSLFFPGFLSTKITLVPAYLLIVSIVSCCNILYMKSKVSLGFIPVYLDIWAMLWAQPSVILFLISATPLPLNAFSWASASANNTALIFAASPSFFAACFLLYEALISFIDLSTSSGGNIFLTWALSIVNPPSFIFGPTLEIMASAI